MVYPRMYGRTSSSGPSFEQRFPMTMASSPSKSTRCEIAGRRISCLCKERRRRFEKNQRLFRDFIAEFSSVLAIVSSHTDNLRRKHRRQKLCFFERKRRETRTGRLRPGVFFKRRQQPLNPERSVAVCDFSVLWASFSLETAVSHRLSSYCGARPLTQQWLDRTRHRPSEFWQSFFHLCRPGTLIVIFIHCADRIGIAHAGFCRGVRKCRAGNGLRWRDAHRARK